MNDLQKFYRQKPKIFPDLWETWVNTENLKLFLALGSWGTTHDERSNTSRTMSHKCLSALGSWGAKVSEKGAVSVYGSQMPLGIEFVGDRLTSLAARWHSTRHKCLSALGSWGRSAMMNYECGILNFQAGKVGRFVASFVFLKTLWN